ncbi:MAG: alpha/beta hydrolase [Sideroxydans sp.]|nr:alpha/beta hydrolase [Sideroxydans sp.]
MRYLNLRIIGLALLLTLFGNASAGSLRDLLNKRNTKQQESELSSDDKASGSFALPQGVRVLKDVSYGNNSAQRMDVYLPASAANAPVIFMVHGGAWRVGDKAASSVVENKVIRWVTRGFIMVSVNYRMLPEADPLTQAGDVAQALASAQAQAPTWGGDPDKFILMGHSAGAHLVALLAASPAPGAHVWLGAVSLDSAVMDVAGIMQKNHYRFYDKAFGKDTAYWKAASPLDVLTTGAKPILLVCSSIRRDKPCDQAHAFAAKAASLSIRTEVSEQALSHKDINRTLGLPGAYTDAVETFMGSLDGSVRKMLSGEK